MAEKKKVKSKKAGGSFFWNAIDSFTAFIYSLFANGRIGTAISSGDGYYKKSLSSRLIEKNAQRANKKNAKYVDAVVNQSRVLRVTGSFREYLSSLSLNIYGIFFVVYGLVSVFMYYLTFALNGKNDHGISALVVSVIMLVCAIPMLVSSKSVGAIIFDSKVMRALSLTFFGLPEEKLKPGRQIGGTEFMFLSAILALLAGIFTYFLHPAYFPIVFGVVLLICIIFSQPEAGVVLAVAMAPFLQFANYPNLTLVSIIAVTLFSYFCKTARRRRIKMLSAETLIVFIFCGFVLVSSFFSQGGAVTMKEALIIDIIILGGFYMTYALVRTQKRLSACVGFIVCSFIILAIVGVWNFVYNGISDGVMYSVQTNVQQIFDNNIIYIADSPTVFGVFAVLVTPLMFSYLAKQKSVRGVVATIIPIALVIVSVFIYGTYEAIVAIAIEFFLFWLLYSHKSLTVMIFAAVPVIIVVLAYPYLERYLGLPDIVESIKAVLPLGFPNASAHISVVQSTVEMLKNGNLSGIGAGKHAFEVVYPQYSNAVSAGVTDPGSHWLQVLCWSGVGGFFTFVIFVGLLAKNSLGHLAVLRDKDLRAETLSLFCGVFVSLIFGTVVCIWDDPRMMFLFWACAGLLAGYVREGREREDGACAEFISDPDHTSVELRFYK